MGIRIGPTWYFVILLPPTPVKSVGDFINRRSPPIFLIPTELMSHCARGGTVRPQLPCGCPGRQWVQEQHGLLVTPFPWVPDSDPTESDTDTKQPRGAGVGGEVRAEKLRKSSEVEAERIRLRAGFLAPFGRPHLPHAQEETLPLHRLGNNERPRRKGLDTGASNPSPQQPESLGVTLRFFF